MQIINSLAPASFGQRVTPHSNSGDVGLGKELSRRRFECKSTDLLENPARCERPDVRIAFLNPRVCLQWFAHHPSDHVSRAERDLHLHIFCRTFRPEQTIKTEPAVWIDC